MIAEVLSAYGREVAPTKKTARNIGYNISNLLKWWGEKSVVYISAKTCRQYAQDRPKMAAVSDIKTLKQAVNYWHAEYGPLNFIPTFWKPKANPPKERWLTRQEAARLLKAAKPYVHLRRLILLGLYTGSRPGVILALRWNQVDLESGIMSRLPRGAMPDAKKRAPKAKLGRRILGHLKRWKRIDGGAEFVCHFNGGAVSDPHRSWPRIVKQAGLEGVTRHTLRHTRATWLMQAGIDPWQAAGHLGMTTKTLERVYGHHHPDWQEEAANV